MSEYERKVDSEQRREDQVRPLSGHDEPVVVDNGPATVFFGKRHLVTSSTNEKTWTREKASNFFALYVQEEEANGEITFVKSWDLAASGKEISLIRVTLGEGESFDYTLVNSATQNLQMVSAMTGLDRDNNSGQLKFKGGKEVGVKRVEGFQNGTTQLIDYTPVTNPKRIKVIIMLKPEEP